MIRWNELDGPLRLTVLIGMVGGILGFVYYYAFLTVPGIWPVLAFLPPYSLAGSLSLLLVSMNRDRRGILGFTVALASIATIIMTVEVVVTCNFSCNS